MTITSRARLWFLRITAGVLLGVVLIAAYFPARRAADTDPVAALRMQ